MPSTARLLDLWQDNAAPWADAVRGGAIESRRAGSDAAVVQAVLRHGPARVLDVGCGEGWLARALAAHGIAVLGVDAVPALVERAAAAGGEFRSARIDELAAAPWAAGFELWVCNFSLFHEDDAPALAAAAAARLPAGGHLVVQTLHERAASGEGWQPGGWGSCGAGFGAPIPWYYRGPAAWERLLHAAGLHGVEITAPVHAGTGQPLSWLVTAQR